MKHVYFSRCLEGAAYDWYCNILEYAPKVYWDLLPPAFSSHWNPITCNIRTVDVSPNLTPPDIICQQLTAQTTHVPPPADCATNSTLNWATDIDESIGPIPSASDFRPTTPLQLVCAPTEPTITCQTVTQQPKLYPLSQTPYPLLLNPISVTWHVHPVQMVSH